MKEKKRWGIYTVIDCETGETIAYGSRKKRIGKGMRCEIVHHGLRTVRVYYRSCMICGRKCLIEWMFRDVIPITRDLGARVTRQGREYGLRGGVVDYDKDERRENKVNDTAACGALGILVFLLGFMLGNML